MAQLICPLCGRLVALSIFDPSDFELDICTVVQTGLGRGRGFSVSDPVSVLGDKQITGLISDRCYKILEMIEGKPIPTSKEVSKHNTEISRLEELFLHWMNETLKLRRARKKDEDEMAGMEDHITYLKNETLKLRKAQKKDEAELGGIEDELRYWKRLASRLKEKLSQLEETVNELKANENEGELLCLEEMDELLDRINESANEDFEYLADAIEYLLEGE